MKKTLIAVEFEDATYIVMTFILNGSDLNRTVPMWTVELKFSTPFNSWFLEVIRIHK